MGEIADMTLDGTLCEGCGEFIGEGPGHPRLCTGCLGISGKTAKKPTTKQVSNVACPQCGKVVKKSGLEDHLRDVHGKQQRAVKPKEFPWSWEQIDPYHQRMKVPGGWLIKSFSEVCHNLIAEGRGIESGWDFREAMCFVPDPKHEWIIVMPEVTRG